MTNKKSKLEKTAKDFYNSKEIPVEELQDLIALSESQRQYESSKREISPPVKKFCGNRNYLTLSSALEIAKEMGLEKYMSKAISTRYIPNEVQVRDLEELGYKLSAETISEVYERELTRCFSTFQNIEILRRNSCIDIYKPEETVLKKKKFFREQEEIIVKNHNLATLVFDDSPNWVPKGKCKLDIMLYDPIVLRICKDTLKKLKEKFKKNWSSHEIEYNYPINIE